MITIRYATSVNFVILASLCMTSAINAKVAKPYKVFTDFGYVLVDALDVKAAIAEGKAAQEAARRLLLISNTRFAIMDEGKRKVRWGSVSAGYVNYPWPFPNGSRRLDARPATNVLRHEIGHDLLERYLIPRSSTNQYGTDAPDWLDEMAAIGFEGAEQQSDRRRTAVKDAAGPGLLPISQLLSMDHPESKTKVADDGNHSIVTVTPTSKDTTRFYSTVQAFYDYLLDRTGNVAIIAELAAAFNSGKDLKMWVADKLRSGRKLESLDQINADFLRWIANDPRYAG